MRDFSTVTENLDRRQTAVSGGERVVLLLDVDGVVNAFGNPAHPKGVNKTVHAVPSGAGDDPHEVGFHIRIGDRVLNAIHAWHDHPLVDLRWCTTWGEQAVTRLAPAFGLPELPVVPGTDYDSDWKTDAARQVLRDETPLIWCDDVWCRSPRIGGLGVHPTPGLFIAPDPNKGLTGRHLRDIDAFITRHTGTPPDPSAKE